MRKRAVGDVASIDAVRIAIGKKVFRSKCSLKFQFGTKTPYIQFSYESEGNLRDHIVYLSQDDELKEVKYHIAQDEDTIEGIEVGDSMTVIAFRITPSELNNLKQYSKSYNQEESDTNIEKNYISVEPRNTEEFQVRHTEGIGLLYVITFVQVDVWRSIKLFQTMLCQMREHKDLGIWCTKESEFQYSDIGKYANALLADSKKDEEERLRNMRVTRSGGRREATKKNTENKLLLVYPFDVDEAVLSGSASALTELGGDSLGLEAEPAAQVDHPSENQKRPSRTHYVTICEDDKDRLKPGQFLNDTLVDFWMRW
jgi:hypothetical protein